MLNTPEELKDEIVSYLSLEDLKILRMALREFHHSASQELFVKRSKSRLVLRGGSDKERGFETAATRAEPAVGTPSWKHKPVEFCRLKSYLPSILPIAKYFKVLDYAPAYWDADLLSVRIGTYSGEEEGFSYPRSYSLNDWEEESGFHSENEDEYDENGPPNVDIWVNKPYTVPDRYTKNQKRIDAAVFLEKYVKEQEEKFEESLEALKQIVSALPPLRVVIIDHWYCHRLRDVIFHWGEFRETFTTRMRRQERHLWRNYQTLIPILRDSKQQPPAIVLRNLPMYPFVSSNMNPTLLNTSISVMNNLQRLRIDLSISGEMPSSWESDVVPGTLYRFFDYCKESLRSLRFELRDERRALRNFFGGGKFKPIVFSKLDELLIEGITLPGTDLEQLIKTQKSLRCLCLYKVFICERAYNWQKLFDDIINPSKIDRVHLYRLWRGVEDNNDTGGFLPYEFSNGPPEHDPIPNLKVNGWREVPVKKYYRMINTAGSPLVREKSAFECFNPRGDLVSVMMDDYYY
ncbi:hypothetical protein TWF173_007019 [Orbilia oligospora]|nr:hypothetical protein TWF173_007019 [Orbilia oligospora]